MNFSFLRIAVYILTNLLEGNLFRCILPPIVNGKPDIIKPVDKFTGLRIKSRLIKNRNIDFLEF